jgi:hypothetical protein
MLTRKEIALKAAATRVGLTLEEYLNVAPGFKRCTECKEIKPKDLEHFGKDTNTNDGLRSKCTPCRNAQKKTSYRKNYEKVRLQQRTYRHENYEKVLAYNAKWQRNYFSNLRLEIIAAYGGKCACCGESEQLFLDLDHINNDGASHRKELGNGRQVWIWLKENNWPTDNYQLLCCNCNQGKSRNGGICPHKQK